jgi:hypothetical protein
LIDPARLCRLKWLLLFAALTLGCGPAKPPVISGSVTVDGQPLAEGTMQFIPSAGDATSAATKIQAGQFSVTLEPTKYQVQIYAPKIINEGAKLDVGGPGGGPTMQETLPPRYNLQSELTLEVTGDKSDVRFDLKTR